MDFALEEKKNKNKKNETITALTCNLTKQLVSLGYNGDVQKMYAQKRAHCKNEYQVLFYYISR